MQLTASVTLAGGTIKQALDPVVTWASSNPGVASVAATGLVTVTGIGEADVTATIQDVRSSVHVTVPVPPPPFARLAVVIDRNGSQFALAGATEVSFDASGSTGTGLRYALVFGDGASADSPIAKHVYGASTYVVNPYTVRVTATDILGRTDSVTQVVQTTRLSTFESWYYPLYPPPAGPVSMRTQLSLVQTGRNIAGWYTAYIPLQPATRVVKLTGTLDGDNTIHLVLDDGSVRVDGPVVRQVNMRARAVTCLTMRVADNGATRDFVYYTY